MSRAPLSPRSFPYTTLFRSERVQLWSEARQDADVVDGARDFEYLSRQKVRSRVERVEIRSVFGRVVESGIDRKSTRLNSSHLGISYSVFCLKKNSRIDS